MAIMTKETAGQIIPLYSFVCKSKTFMRYDEFYAIQLKIKFNENNRTKPEQS